MLEGRTPGVLREEEWVFQKSAKKERNNAKMKDPTKRALGGWYVWEKLNEQLHFWGPARRRQQLTMSFITTLEPFPPISATGNKAKKEMRLVAELQVRPHCRFVFLLFANHRARVVIGSDCWPFCFCFMKQAVTRALTCPAPRPGIGQGQPNHGPSDPGWRRDLARRWGGSCKPLKPIDRRLKPIPRPGHALGPGGLP